MSEQGDLTVEEKARLWQEQLESERARFGPDDRPVSIEAYHLEDAFVDPNPLPVDYPSPDLPRQLVNSLGDRANEVIGGTLTTRQKHVLDLRFGFTLGKEMSLREVGVTLAEEEGRLKPFGVSDIWGIEHRALAKLRTPENTAKMQEALQ